MKPTNAPPPETPGEYHAHGRHHSPDEMHSAGVEHEHSDINIRAVLGFATGLAVVVGVVCLIVWGIFVGLERYAASNDPLVSPLAAQPGQLPPEPRLLTNEPARLSEVRGEEASRLQGYGWVDQGAGVAHIPIEEAMKKIVERGLPTRAEAPANPRLGTMAPAMGESSSGRVLGDPK